MSLNYGTEITLSSIGAVSDQQIIFMTDEKAIVAYTIGTTGYVCVAAVASDGTITLGTPVAFSTETPSSLDLMYINSYATSAILTYVEETNGYNCYAVGIKVDGYDIDSFSTPTLVASNVEKAKSTTIGPTFFVVAYQDRTTDYIYAKQYGYLYSSKYIFLSGASTVVAAASDLQDVIRSKYEQLVVLFIDTSNSYGKGAYYSTYVSHLATPTYINNINAGATSHMSGDYLRDTTFVCAYTDDSDNGSGKVVGFRSYNNLYFQFGTPATFHASTGAATKAEHNKIVVSPGKHDPYHNAYMAQYTFNALIHYSDKGNSGYGTSKEIKISGALPAITITGNDGVFNAAATGLIKGTPIANLFSDSVIMFQDGGDLDYGKLCFINLPQGRTYLNHGINVQISAGRDIDCEISISHGINMELVSSRIQGAAISISHGINQSEEATKHVGVVALDSTGIQLEIVGSAVIGCLIKISHGINESMTSKVKRGDNLVSTNGILLLVVGDNTGVRVVRAYEFDVFYKEGNEYEFDVGYSTESSFDVSI